MTEANNGDFDKIHKHIDNLKKKKKIAHYDLPIDSTQQYWQINVATRNVKLIE